MSELGYELEQAFVSYLTPIVGTLGNIYGGKSPGEKVLPAVICEAQGEGEEDPKLSGNFVMGFMLRPMATAATEADGADPTTADNLLVSAVWHAVCITDLDAQLNAQGRILTVFPNGFFLSAPTLEQDALGGWHNVIRGRVYCCNSVLAP